MQKSDPNNFLCSVKFKIQLIFFNQIRMIKKSNGEVDKFNGISTLVELCKAEVFFQPAIWFQLTNNHLQAIKASSDYS